MVEFDNIKSISEFISNEEIIIFNYYAKWCAPCKSIYSHLLEMENTFKRVTIINVNVDNFTDLAHEQNIRAIPTLHYFKKGELYLKESGFRTKDHIYKNFESLINIDAVLLK